MNWFGLFYAQPKPRLNIHIIKNEIGTSLRSTLPTLLHSTTPHKSVPLTQCEFGSVLKIFIFILSANKVPTTTEIYFFIVYVCLRN
jgi:hypothetical protein